MADLALEHASWEQWAVGSTEHQLIQEFGALSGRWRGAIEELTDRFDGAHQGLKETIRHRLDLTERVYVAARAWSPAPESEGDEDLRFLMAYLIRDLREAYETAETTVSRRTHDDGR